MTRVMLVLSFAAVSWLALSDAAGQSLRQPSSINSASYEYYQPDVVESPSDIEPPEIDQPTDTPEPESIADEYFGGDGYECDGGARLFPCCRSACDEPWTLFGENCLGITLGGWIEAGATASADNPPSRFVAPVAFNDRDEVQMNQLYLFAERSLSGDPCTWDIGGRVDFVYGTDARFLQVPGLELRRNGGLKWSTERFYRLAMPQFYAELGRGPLSVKAGHWYTTIGYEVVTAPDNFFYSHAYTMLYAEPFTHTGVMLNWDVNERISAYAAIHNGWDTFDAVTNRAGVLTGINWTSCDERTTVAFAITTGDEINNQNVYSNRTMYSIVGTRQINDQLLYVIQHDNGVQQADLVGGGDGEWYGLNQYLFYTVNDCWTLGGRFEWFRDDDGTRVDGASIGNFYQASLGVNWLPTPNFRMRPELRWDWFDGVGLPFDDGTKDNQFTAAFDIIWTF